MKAFICIDPSGRILELGVLSPRVWDVATPLFEHTVRYEVSHETKLLIESEGADHFFATLENEVIGEPIGSDLSGKLEIRRKQEVKLTASPQVFLTGDKIMVLHDATVPIKLWAGNRPVRGKHVGKVSSAGHTFGSSAPGYYTIRVRDPRHWAEPLVVRAVVERDSIMAGHLLT